MELSGPKFPFLGGSVQKLWLKFGGEPWTSFYWRWWIFLIPLAWVPSRVPWVGTFIPFFNPKKEVGNFKNFPTKGLGELTTFLYNLIWGRKDSFWPRAGSPGNLIFGPGPREEFWVGNYRGPPYLEPFWVKIWPWVGVPKGPKKGRPFPKGLVKFSGQGFFPFLGIGGPKNFSFL